MAPNFEVLPPGSRLPPTKPPKRGGLIGVLIAVGAVLIKIALPALTFLKTGGLMLLSVAAYSYAFQWTWSAAAVFVILIFVHEMGHAISARFYGIPVSAPVFIPFMGAYVLLKNRPLDPWINAIISYAGPLAGGLGGWVCYGLGLTLDCPWLLTVAFYTFLLNLFNLLPVPPLDGSHIWITFSRSWTPQMKQEDRYYMGLYLAALIAGLLLGCLHCWRYMHPAS